MSRKVTPPIEERARLALTNKVKEDKHLELNWGLREDFGMKTYLHGPTDYVKNIRLRFCVGGLDPPDRRKRYTSSREEENVATNVCPCNTTIE